MPKRTKLVEQDQLTSVFKSLDNLIDKALSQQIKQLASHFRIHAVQQLNNDEENGEPTIPVSAQQLIIEYTCLPLLSIPEDPEPTNEFSLRFLHTMETHYLDFEPIQNILTRLILPVLLIDFTQQKEKNTENIRQVQTLINCYIASLVSTCQAHMLSELATVLDLFSAPVRQWMLRTFFLPTAKRSKFQAKRDVASKTIGDFSADLLSNPFIQYEPVKFLSQEAEPIQVVSDKRVVLASQLIQSILDTAVNIALQSRNLDTINRLLSRVLKVLKLTINRNQERKSPIFVYLLFSAEESKQILSSIERLMMFTQSMYASPSMIDTMVARSARAIGLLYSNIIFGNSSNAVMHLFAHDLVTNVMSVTGTLCKSLHDAEEITATRLGCISSLLKVIAKLTETHQPIYVSSDTPTLIDLAANLDELTSDMNSNRPYLVSLPLEEFNSIIIPIAKTTLLWPVKYLVKQSIDKVNKSQIKMIQSFSDMNILSWTRIFKVLHSYMINTASKGLSSNLKAKLVQLFQVILQATIVVDYGAWLTSTPESAHKAIISHLMMLPQMFQALDVDTRQQLTNISLEPGV
jgi:hypothetical protein